MSRAQADMPVVVAALLACLAAPARPYSMGAPDSACQEMLPGHQHQAQQGSVPANLTLTAGSVLPGQMVGLELAAGPVANFKGFMIQARAQGDGGPPVGSFVVSGDEASYMTCGRGIHNSITHRTNQPKERIKAQWRAPRDFTGSVVFRFTYLREYSTFWVGQQSAALRVGRALEPEGPAAAPAPRPSAKAGEGAAAGGEAAPVATTEAARTATEEEAEAAVEVEVIQPSSVAENTVETEDSYTPVYISTTTTLRTTTSTTELPRELPLLVNGVQQYTRSDDSIYDGCSSATTNSSKACFGMPAGCEQEKRCQVVVSYQPEGLSYVFKMKGLSNGYIALGLSRDDKMGSDLTTACMIRSDGTIGIVTGVTVGHSGNKIVPAGQNNQKLDGIEERIEYSILDGWISCKWRRPAGRLELEGEVWDLERDTYHIMLAQGTVTDGTPDIHRAKIISGVNRGLGEVGLVTARSNLFIVLHGSFMIGAWVCAASLGIIVARYYKQTWTSSRCGNLDQWFVWHRCLMMLTWTLTVVGCVLIVVDLKGLSQTLWPCMYFSLQPDQTIRKETCIDDGWEFWNPHALLGFITVGLCFLQPFLALVRCAPSHRHRAVFNWLHWLVGNSAQILAIVCIFYAVDLDKAQLPRPETDWLLVAFVAFHFLSHLLLSCLSCRGEASNSKSGYPLAMRPLARHGGPYPDYEELRRDQPGSAVRTFVIIVYALVNIIVTAALILLVVMAPTRQQLVKIGILPSL